MAGEGINATVGGSQADTQLYMDAFMAHPLFSDMTPHDFKVTLTVIVAMLWIHVGCCAAVFIGIQLNEMVTLKDKSKQCIVCVKKRK